MVDRLNVFVSDRLVGTLSYDNSINVFEFRYDSDYLSDPNARELSQSLPLCDQPFDALKSKVFFENLLPPEVVRRRLEKIIHISYENVFGYLKALGGDCAGAVSLYADGVMPSSVPARSKVEVAPQYDLMSTVVYPELGDRPAMRIGGADFFHDVRRENFKAMAQKAEIDARLVLARLDDMTECIRGAADELAVEMSDEGNPSPIYAHISEVIRQQVERVS